MQWRVLQHEQPEDIVIATGRQESVRRFIELAASELGLGGIDWECKALRETGLRADTSEVMGRIDPRYFSAQRRRKLRWMIPPGPKRSSAGMPTTTLEELVAEMVAVT
jgi:GDPmannose 4,6-dehydratase